jgi:hypothetical protein
MLKRFRRWICSVFGHFFSEVDVLVFKIKTNELNNDMNAIIKCRCCGEEFAHKNSPLVK